MEKDKKSRAHHRSLPRIEMMCKKFQFIREKFEFKDKEYFGNRKRASTKQNE